MERRVPRAALVATLLVALAAVSAPFATAQPDPRQMSGIPLPDPQLPAGTVTVRVIRGSMTNNVPDHPVELRIADDVAMAATGPEGRAEFAGLTPGLMAVAATELDGVRLESEPFPVPDSGGIRLILAGAADPVLADAPAEPGTVTFGRDSEIRVQLGEETLSVFYMLGVRNARDVPVITATPLTIALPDGAQGATMFGNSSPRTTVEGLRVSLAGPFAPGMTPLRVAYVLPYSGPSLVVAQALPANLESLFLAVQKWGAMDLASDQVGRRADMSPDGPDGDTYILAAGPRVAAGVPLSFEISGLPYHSAVPGQVTLALAFVILAAGVWAAATPPPAEGGGAERLRRLESRREKRFADLVKLEQQHRNGRIGATRHTNRRRELMADLERIYGELDDEAAPMAFSVAAARHAAPVTPHSGNSG